MTVKISVYIATSLDGFIARPNGDIDWLTGGEGSDDYGYAEFISKPPLDSANDSVESRRYLPRI